MNMKTVVTGALCLLMLGPVVNAAFTPTEGAQVEVREGDRWSHATYLRKEGRKLQVRYDDGTEEWVMPDRLRAPTGPGATAGTTPAPDAGVAAGGAGAAGQEVSLDGTPIEIRMDNAPGPRVAIGSPLRLKPTTRPAATTVPFVKLTPAVATPVETPKQFIICPDTPQIVVGVTDPSFGETCQVLCIDLTKPQTFEVRSIDSAKHEIIGAAGGGKFLLSTPHLGDSVTLHLWEYDGKAYKPKANYTLTSKRGGKKVKWASLQSDTRAVVGTDGDECYLVDFKACRAIAVVREHHNAKDTIQYDGSVMGVQEGSISGLMRGSDFTIVTKYADSGAVEAVDPTGTYVAVGAGADIRVVRTATGAPVGTLHGVGGRGKGVDLLSGDMIMVNRQTVYDIKTGMPVAEYVMQDLRESQLLPTGQMLMAFGHGGTTALCLATLPDAAAVAAAKAAKPADFLISKGAQISVSGDLASIYGTDLATATDVLEKSVTSAGHKLSATPSRYVLVFKSTPGKTGEFAYREPLRPGEMMMGPRPSRVVPAPCTDVSVTLTCDGEPIWMQGFHFQAGFFLMTDGKSIEQAVADEGRPKVATLAGLAIPTYIPVGSTPQKTAALRTSTLGPDGFGPSTTPTPAPPAPKAKPPVPSGPTA